LPKQNRCNYETPVSAAELKVAFDKALDILGISAKEALLESLQQEGVELDKIGSQYSLKQIERVLLDIFHEDATFLIMERLWSALEEE
jgi:hypothetical protein